MESEARCLSAPPTSCVTSGQLHNLCPECCHLENEDKNTDLVRLFRDLDEVDK